MTDLKISEFVDGGAVEETDEIAAVRAGVNTKVSFGTMAAQNTTDYGKLSTPNSWTDVQTFTQIDSPVIQATDSSGITFKTNGGSTWLHGANGGSPNATAYGGWNFDAATANTIASFGASKTLTSLNTGTYPSLTELAYVKGVTSAIQTQIDGLSGGGRVTPQGRLTLTSGLPVTTSDVTAASTLYYTPRNGNRLSTYNGSAWVTSTFTERSLALSALTSGRPYDVFIYDNSGTLTLELTAWTNDTTRATALTYQDGVLVKSGATTRLYLGTIYTTSTSTTEDSAANRYVWNYYNRVDRALLAAAETADTWNYTTATYRQANANTANQLNFVIGVSEDYTQANVVASAANTSAGVNMLVGIGLDSTSSDSSLTLNGTQRSQVASGTTYTQTMAAWKGIVAAGRHYLAWLEFSTATGTTTWIGDAGGGKRASGIHGSMRA